MDMDALQNNQTTQSVKNAVANGPVGQNVKQEAAKTQNEFADIANARRTPSTPAATGQPLTHYHSMFYRILSWKNPRATSIAFASTVLFIFAARYLDIIRWSFKAGYIVLGITTAAELAGKAVFGSGFTSQIRPKKYFVIPKASLERFLDDAEQLINFFIIETQRIVFAENVYVTLGAFVSAFISYYLIKFVPLWGLSLISTCILFLAPLIYVQNKEIIDGHIETASNMVGQQANQFRDLAAQQTGRASETFKSYAGEYTQKAQDYIGSARGRATSPGATVNKADLPSAPTKAPVAPAKPAAEAMPMPAPASEQPIAQAY